MLHWEALDVAFNLRPCHEVLYTSLLCKFPDQSTFTTPVQLPVPQNTIGSRVPLIVCPLQHVTHAMLACEQDSLCLSLQGTRDRVGHDTNCNLPTGVTQPYFSCGAFEQFVSYSLVCDFREDCKGGGDEDFCVHPACKENMVDCGLGQCLNLDKFCDGLEDCVTTIDEMNCPYGNHITSSIKPPAVVNFDKPGGFSVTPLPADTTTTCPDTHFQCHDGGFCLPVYVRCNDVYDCPHREDESECHSYRCPGFYRCRGNKRAKCVHLDHVCDGLVQCPLHDDELLCNMTTCPEPCTCNGLAFTCNDTFHVRSFPQLRYLEARASGFKQDDITQNTMLIHLGVQACGWSSLMDITLPNLHSLDLSNNLLLSLNFSHFARTRHLRRLSLAGNPVTGTFSGVKKHVSFSVVVFNFSRVQVDYLNLSIFSYVMPHLEVLDLSWSEIKSLQGQPVFERLRVFNLDGCPVSDFATDLMKSMNSLSYVLSENFKMCCSVVLPDTFRVSAFLICLITLDRFIVLRFPFSHTRFRAMSAHIACSIIWALGLLLAAVPLFSSTSHWEFYHQTDICIPLPITRADFAGHMYSFSVMIVCNLILFLLIAVGQSLIYWSVKSNTMSDQIAEAKGSEKAKSKDTAIARRLITIAMSDFLCWFPIGLCGLLAANDVIIPGEVNVAMAIFILPLNSALNPFIYTVNVSFI
ncbi:uncharacterized protein LOC143283470 [Babylonia areolata]|uniref:uncharacterized protein LOC143283470 n=1 Tax=Babylonia areolata TaxID=304850 RepID=UPI003FD15EF3